MCETNKVDRILGRLRLRSTTMLIVAVVMLWRVSEWGMSFAESCMRNGTDIALILSAVGVPSTVLAGYVFKIYQDGKKQ